MKDYYTIAALRTRAKAAATRQRNKRRVALSHEPDRYCRYAIEDDIRMEHDVLKNEFTVRYCAVVRDGQTSTSGEVVEFLLHKWTEGNKWDRPPPTYYP